MCMLVQHFEPQGMCFIIIIIIMSTEATYGLLGMGEEGGGGWVAMNSSSQAPQATKTKETISHH